MFCNFVRSLVVGAVLAFFVGTLASAEQVIIAKQIADNLRRPVYATHAPGQPNHLYLLEQHSGRVKVLDLQTDTIVDNNFLSVPRLSRGNEQGLLGLAFHPDYETNGRLFINATLSNGRTIIREYRTGPDRMAVLPDFERTILEFQQPQSNHNGGWIGFGPQDGYLYIASGDGGAANDNGSGHTPGIGNAQDITDNWLGKMLRVNVNGNHFPGNANRNYAIPPTNPFVGTDGDDEIWAYGLRNPWRASFDRETADLYIADVGQDRFEEIDFQPAGSPGGENYGWRLREGSIATPGVGGDPPPGHVPPIYEYRHGNGPDTGFSVTGGYVYRGPIESLQGEYFFADFVSNQIWSLQHDGAVATQVNNWTTSIISDEPIAAISSFGEDAAGNLYIVSLDGNVFRIDDVADVVTMVPAGAEWKYLDDGSDQGTAWRTIDFDDSNWKSGPAQLGYGERDENTVIEEGDPRHATSYFRHHFQYDGDLDIESLSVELLYDDGAAVYLNGEEIVRTPNLAPDAQFDDLANFNGARARGGQLEDIFERFVVDPSKLIVGENVLAVEVHQHSLSSSDLSFDLRLAAILAKLGILGDFNQDGILDALDIDALSEAVRANSSDLTFDLNQDGLVSSDDRRVWVEQIKKTWFGDANLDGEFSSADLVLVFQAAEAEYEDAIPNNSTWSEGDWDGDGDFTSSDFVFAFASSGYEKGPRGKAVPEPGFATIFGAVVLSVLVFARKRGSRAIDM